MKISLDERALQVLLEYILSAIKEDRKLALENHDAVVGLIQGAAGEQLSGLEVQMFLQSLSSALNGFLNNASKSTDNAIKIAKLLSDHIIKRGDESMLTDEDREELARLANAEEAFAREQGEISRSIIDPNNIEGLE